MKSGILYTVDDGFVEDYTISYQKQIDMGLEPRGTSYIITNNIVMENRVSWEQIKTMISNGWDVQCHSHFHKPEWYNDPPTITEADVNSEMQLVDEAFLLNNLGTCKHHAYPGGKNNIMIRSMVGRYRLTMRTVNRGFITKSTNLQRIPTFALLNLSKDEITQLIKIAKRDGFFVGFYTHSDKYTDNPENLEKYIHLIECSKRYGLPFITISELYNIMIKK